MLKNILKKAAAVVAQLGWQKSASSVPLMDMSEILHLPDRHEAIKELLRHLEVNPTQIEVLNNLGVYYADIGNQKTAAEYFKLAYSMDDTYVASIVNHANLLTEELNAEQALIVLGQVRVAVPDFPQIYINYARICFLLGDYAAGYYFHRKAWMGQFDNLRYANGYMWWSVFHEDENVCAMEHRFWAQTMLPLQESNLAAVEEGEGHKNTESSRIRIGYWSPDLASHSVRFFARPLIENHNPDKFEVFIFHDTSKFDRHTQSIKDSADHFFDVYNISDADLVALIKAQKLDVLVELAGHTSYNRIPLLRNRLAKLQLSALGYPPTTGLANLDAKVVDGYLYNEKYAQLHSEAPMIMPKTFWCFDPMEDVVIAPNPPVQRNKYITFACVGNVVKINAPLIACWKRILNLVPDSKLLLRSVNFADPLACTAALKRMTEAGLPEQRILICRPEGEVALLKSYNEIDIVLDTYPFNGGTTTCFATYMGVPVISRRGTSVAGRMGYSVLSNLGCSQWTADSDDEYVQKAVALANNIHGLIEFRSSARGLYKNSSLGNGRLYAGEFESACEEILRRKNSGEGKYISLITDLPERELVRRAYEVLRLGQYDAATRIARYCLQVYPNSRAAHIVLVQEKVKDELYSEVVQYLERLDAFDGANSDYSLQITLCRLYWLLGRNTDVEHIFSAFDLHAVADVFDRLQLLLYKKLLESFGDRETTHVIAENENVTLKVGIVCTDRVHYEEMVAQISSICHVPSSWVVQYEQIPEHQLAEQYRERLSESAMQYTIVLHNSVEIHRNDFFVNIVNALHEVDAVSFAGALVRTRWDWREQRFSDKAGAFCIRDANRSSRLEMQWAGCDSGALLRGMKVLDGNVFGVRTELMAQFQFDADLEGSLTLMEEEWLCGLESKGHQLAVCRDLGVVIDQKYTSDDSNKIEARLKVIEQNKFDLFDMSADDAWFVCAPVTDAVLAVATFTKMCEFRGS